MEELVDEVNIEIPVSEAEYNQTEMFKQDKMGYTTEEILNNSSYQASSWNRFDGEVGELTWFSKGNQPDGIIFIPQSSLYVLGFTTFAGINMTSYYMMYEIKVDNVLREGDLVEATWTKGNEYFRYRLKKPIPVKEGQEIEILVWITTNMNTFEKTPCYRSDNGLDYDTHKALDKGLFEMKETK